MWLALLQAGLLASYGSAAAALFLVACVEPEGDGRLAEIANWLFDAPERLLRACDGARRGARCAAPVRRAEPRAAAPVPAPGRRRLRPRGRRHVPARALRRARAAPPAGRAGARAVLPGDLGQGVHRAAGLRRRRRDVREHDNYAYDGCLYEAGGTCPTTGVPKPARAKFCRTTRRVVARFDHLPWVNNAVGEENYRWFLLFLASHALLLAYGAACAALLLRDVVDAKQRMRATFYLGDAPVAATRGVVVHYLLPRARAVRAAPGVRGPRRRRRGLPRLPPPAGLARPHDERALQVAPAGPGRRGAGRERLRPRRPPQRARGPLPAIPAARRARAVPGEAREGGLGLSRRRLARAARGNTGRYPPAPA